MVHDFGFQLVLKAHSKDIKNSYDVLIVLVHWRLLRYGFICLGDGPSSGKLPSEVLPLNLGWDGTLKGYFLKYENMAKQFLLSLHIKENGTEVGLLSDSRVTKVAVEIKNIVDPDTLVPNMDTIDELNCRIDNDLIEPLGFRKVQESWMRQWINPLKGLGMLDNSIGLPDKTVEEECWPDYWRFQDQ